MQSLFLALAFILMIAGPAEAGTLRTPLVQANNFQRIECVMTNLGKKPTEISVSGIDESGNARAVQVGDCGATLNARASCSVQFDSNEGVFCEFQAKGKFSGSLQVLGPSMLEVRAVVPATRK